MKKVYIVQSTNQNLGYELLTFPEIISTFSSRKKALAFIESEKKRILEENEDEHIKLLSDIDNDVYFLAESDHDWFEILLIEKELN